MIRLIWNKKVELATDAGKKTAQFVLELLEESDRSLVITSLAKIDVLLKDILKSYLSGSKNFKKDLFEFNGPLGTLSSKIKMSFALRIIDKGLYESLNTLRKLRNEFAHKIEAKSFSDKTYTAQLTTRFNDEIELIKFTYELLSPENVSEKYSKSIEDASRKYLSILITILLVLETCLLSYSTSDHNITITFGMDSIKAP